MAATMTLRKTAKILTFRTPCECVNRTDNHRRLPTITSDEIESLFDQLCNTKPFRSVA